MNFRGNVMLETILVGDNRVYLQKLTQFCRKSEFLNVRGTFEASLEALKFAGENKVDFALLGIEMSDMSGLALGKILREHNPEIILIYTIDKYEQCAEALRMKADYCIFKPYQYDDVRDAIERAVLLHRRSRSSLEVRAFGRFCVFIKKEAVHFPNAKSKELLALCIDRRGGDVTMEDAVNELWPDKPYDERVKKLYRKAVINLKMILREHLSTEVFSSFRGGCRIDMEQIQCDYYIYLADPIQNKRMFGGEYMTNYSWAQETEAGLCFLTDYRKSDSC